MCANLLSVTLDIQGSSIAMKNGTHIWLYQKQNTLTGERDLRAFTGLLEVATGNESSVCYYKAAKDASVGLYAEGSTVTFRAETISGKPFEGWIAEGITLTDSSASEISFVMPANEVILKTKYHTLVSGVSLNFSELSMKVGETQNLVAVVSPEDASDKQINWSSSDSDVAMVNENGIVTAKKSGTAVITVTTVEGEKTASCKITVVELEQNVPDDSGNNSGGGFGYNDSDSDDDEDSSGSSSESSNGTVSYDNQKGYVNSVTGIITGATGSLENDGYSHWLQDEKGWKLRYADGTYACGIVQEEKEKNTWEKINHAWYLFGIDGYMKTGWYFDTEYNAWYYLDENTGMKTGWYLDLNDNRWYYFGADGAMKTGWQEIDGKWQFLNNLVMPYK